MKKLISRRTKNIISKSILVDTLNQFAFEPFRNQEEEKHKRKEKLRPKAINQKKGENMSQT